MNPFGPDICGNIGCPKSLSSSRASTSKAKAIQRLVSLMSGKIKGSHSLWVSFWKSQIILNPVPSTYPQHSLNHITTQGMFSNSDNEKTNPSEFRGCPIFPFFVSVLRRSQPTDLARRGAHRDIPRGELHAQRVRDGIQGRLTEGPAPATAIGDMYVWNPPANLIPVTYLFLLYFLEL